MNESGRPPFPPIRGARGTARYVVRDRRENEDGGDHAPNLTDYENDEWGDDLTGFGGGNWSSQNDPYVRWGDRIDVQIAAPLGAVTQEVPEFLNYVLPVPLVTMLRLSASSPQAVPSAAMIVTWTVYIGLGAAMQRRTFVQQVSNPATGLPADIVFTGPARVIRVAASVTVTGVPATQTELIAQAAPFFFVGAAP